MKQLLINADDFGRHPAINDAVELAFKQGCLCSASLMAGEPYFDEAVTIARHNPGLRLGAHLTLVDGTPVLPVEKLPTLAPQGRFYANHRAFISAYARGKINLAEINLELQAQMNKICSTQLPISHIDSHQHLHILPAIFPCVIELAKTYKITNIRLPKTNWQTAVLSHNGGLRGIIGRGGLWLLASLAQKKLRQANLFSADHFAGLVAGNAVDENNLGQIIENLPQGITEIMTHPGNDNKVLQAVTHWQHDFVAELHALLSNKISQDLALHHIQLLRK